MSEKLLQITAEHNAKDDGKVQTCSAVDLRRSAKSHWTLLV